MQVHSRICRPGAGRFAPISGSVMPAMKKTFDGMPKLPRAFALRADRGTLKNLGSLGRALISSKDLKN